jgi:beta-fructofuranosidase
VSDGPTDPHRPRVHLTAPRGWLNDPNGFVRWRGRYHLFFQHHPSRPLWGPPEWAHVVSDDLVGWHALPPALTPAMPPADPDGCWSGSTALIDGRPVVHYTGVLDGVQATCRAEPLDDDLVRWVKDPGNPVVRAPDHEPIHHGAFRDPFVWREGDGWRMLVGTSLDDHGAALLYASDDGRTWRYLHPLIDPDDAPALQGHGRLWECPLLLRGREVGSDDDVLIVGVWDLGLLSHVVAVIGRFTGDRFVPDAVHRLDHGDACFYAPQAIAREDRWTLIGWLQEQRPDAALLEAGWAGALSLPREVWTEGGELRTAFAIETATLRGDPVAVEATGPGPLHAGHAYEARLRVERRGAEALALDLLASDDGEERTRLEVDWVAGALTIDKSRSSSVPGPSSARQIARYGAIDEDVELHLVVDGSVIEAIADGRVAVSTRAYPSRRDATRLRRVDGSTARVSGTIWPLRRSGLPAGPGDAEPPRPGRP